MATYPAQNLNPYYSALQTWLYESHNADGTPKSDIGMPTGHISLADPTYGCPTNGSSDCATALEAAKDDTPEGGAIWLPPWQLALSQFDFSDRPDIHLFGLGGFRDVDDSTPLGTVIKPLNNSVDGVLKCVPSSLSQYGPQLVGITIANIDAKTSLTGFKFGRVNGWSMQRCGGKYITGPALSIEYVGGDSAWSDVQDFWAYQCTVGINLDQLLNCNIRRVNLDIVDGTVGIRGRNYAQNCFFSQINMDGQNVAGVGKGIGFHIENTGAHHWYINQFKAEALAKFAYLQNPGGTPTSNICFSQGVISGVNEGGGNDGIGFDIESGVEATYIGDDVNFSTMDLADMVVDANSAGAPYTRWHRSQNETPVLAAGASAADIRTFLVNRGDVKPS